MRIHRDSKSTIGIFSLEQSPAVSGFSAVIPVYNPTKVQKRPRKIKGTASREFRWLIQIAGEFQLSSWVFSPKSNPFKRKSDCVSALN